MTTLLVTQEKNYENTVKKTLRAGFSLVEIMIVITIIGLLAYFMVPKLFLMVTKARAKTTRLKIGGVKSALLMYKTDTGDYPEKLKDLLKKPADEKAAKKWEGPYLEEESQMEDSWGEMLKYQKTANGYDLYSYGPNKKEGSTKDEYIRAD